jgi:hypothetical protein
VCAHFSSLYPTPLGLGAVWAAVRRAAVTSSGVIRVQAHVSDGGGSEGWWVGTACGALGKNFAWKTCALVSGVSACVPSSLRKGGKRRVGRPFRVAAIRQILDASVAWWR